MAIGTKIRFLKEKKFRNAILFTGLPGIGLVGKICVDYLLKQAKTTKIADIYSDSFPPSVHTKRGIVELIKDELHYFSHNKQDYIFLSGPVQPSLDMRGGMEEHYEFANTIIKEIKQRGVKSVYTLAGLNIGERRMLEEPGVVVAATSKELLKEWEETGAKTDKHEGLISGVAGLLLGLAKEEDIDGVCLMGETNARLIYGDHGAAKKVLELLVKKFKFRVNMDSIEKESQSIERAFSQLQEKFTETEEPPRKGLSYVR